MPKPKTRAHTAKSSVFDLPEPVVPEKTRAQLRAESIFIEQADMTEEQKRIMNSIQMKVTSISVPEGLLFKLQRYVTDQKQTVSRRTSASSVIVEALEEFFNEK